MPSKQPCGKLAYRLGSFCKQVLAAASQRRLDSLKQITNQEMGAVADWCAVLLYPAGVFLRHWLVEKTPFLCLSALIH